MIKFILIFLLIQAVKPKLNINNNQKETSVLNSIEYPVLLEVLTDRRIRKLQKSYFKLLDSLMLKALKKREKDLPLISSNYRESAPQNQRDTQKDLRSDEIFKKGQLDVSTHTIIPKTFKRRKHLA